MRVQSAIDKCLERGGLPLILAVTIGLLFVVASCNQNSQDSRKPKIAGILFMENESFLLGKKGMEAAAKKEGMTMLFGNSMGALDKEIALIDAYVIQGVDAIIISPLSRKSSIPALQRAHTNGSRIVAYNTTIDADFLESFIESDQTELGTLTGRVVRQYVEEKLGGKAKIAMLEFQAFAPEQGTLRCDGFRSEILELPGIEIVAEQDAWMAPEACNVTETLLTRYHDLDIIWAANEGGTVGAVNGVRNSGRAGAVVVFGTDMSGLSADFLLDEENILQAVTGQEFYDIGYMAVEVAAKTLRGEAITKKTQLPGILYSRERPDEVRAFKEMLAGLTE